MNWRMLPPANPSYLSRVVNGRTYTGTPGVPMTVPDFDAGMLQANGWTFVTQTGPTTARPTGDMGAYRGARFFDETLGREVVHDGTTWRDAAGGGIV